MAAPARMARAGNRRRDGARCTGRTTTVVSTELPACAAPAGRVAKGVTTDPMRLYFPWGLIRLFGVVPFFSLIHPIMQARMHRSA